MSGDIHRNVATYRGACTDCGVCYADCPDVFEKDGANSMRRIVATHRVGGDPGVEQVRDELAECARSAADAYAVEAICVEE